MPAPPPDERLARSLRDAPASPTCVGFSGGLDSTVLLHALASDPAVRARGLRALHVNHGLHPDAGAWAAHCRDKCAALAVPLEVMPVEVVAGGRGPEADARAARHAAFARTLGEGEAMALAHHRDDQAETFLLRAMRGSGPEGLAAMPARRPCGRGVLWRPLLALPRTVLVDYAQAHGLDWIHDPSNDDISLDRNFLRSRVLPLLRERWPGADAALARSAALSAEGASLLAPGDADGLALARIGDPAVLSRAALALMPRERRARVLRRWVAGLGLPPLPAGGVARIESEVLPAPADASACYAWHGAEVRAWRDQLHAGRPVAALPPGWAQQWDGRAALPLPGGGTLRLDPPVAFDPAMTVRARAGGERIALAGRGHSHALKHVLQDLGVPPWRRAAMPLLVDADDTVHAAGDRIVSAALDAWLRARRTQLAWSPCPAYTSPMPRKPAADPSAANPARSPGEASPVADFEASLDQLEHLVGKMEHGDMTLEESLAAYERGVGLYRRCQAALEQAELRVRLLSDPDRPDRSEPFEPPTAPDA